LYFFSVISKLILTVVHRIVRLFCLLSVAAILAALAPARLARADVASSVGRAQVIFSYARRTGVSPTSPQAGLVAPVVEGDLVGPSALAYDQGNFYVLDPLNRAIIVQDPASGARRKIPLPDGYFADMVIQANTIYLRDFNRPGVLALDETKGQILAAKSTLGRQQISTDLPLISDFNVETRRTDDHQGWMTISDTAKALLAILSIQSGYYLGSATLVGRDSLGSYSVLVEELLEDVPEMLVQTSVRRYAPDGTFLDAALLPMDAIDYFPNRPVAVDPQGGAYFLKVAGTRADVVRLDFNAGMPATLESRWEAVRPPAQSTPGVPSKPVPGAAPITRQQIIQNANSYLTVNWTLSAANYHSGPAGNWNNCAANKEGWRLPRTLVGRVGQVIAEVPYAWGGYQSIADFQSQIKRGDWAGNICDNQVVTNVAGVDCAGFVSQVLQAGAYYLAADKGLGRVSTPIDWSQLAPGDLLLKSGSHVMLFDAFANPQTLDGEVWAYESTTRNGADRVGHNLVNFSTLSTYSPRRYNNVVEAVVPANQNLIRNGDFNAGPAQWGFWGEIDVDGRDGLLYFKRRSASPYGAGVYQDINAVAASGSAFEVTADLGNSSNVDKQVTLNLRDPNLWTGALSCPFTIPANSDPQTYRLAGDLPDDWENTRFEIDVVSADGQPDLILDNVAVVYRPDLQPAGVECSASDPTPPAALWLGPSYSSLGWTPIDSKKAAVAH
jgi:cell wall-associated NlpC family hydrolase